VSKGSTAELEVRRLLEAWWRQLEPEIEITRTPGSGGWRHAAKWGAKADLMVREAPRFPFAIEVKRREGWSPRELYAGRPCPVWKWWAKTCQDAATIGPDRVPMLWARRNREPWIVLVPAKWWAELANQDALPIPHVEWEEIHGLDPNAPFPVGLLGVEILACKPDLFALCCGSS